MRQTAVEWLQQALEQTILTHNQIMQTIGLFEQAKEMEKEQIRDAYFMGCKTREHKPINTEARHADYSNYYLRDIYGL